MIKSPWFPTINLEKCDGCKGAYKCVGFCPYKVLELKEGKPFIANPLNCIHGCSSCASLCRNGAIIFPTRQSFNKSEKKGSSLHRITCVNCGKEFLTNRQTQYCFDCEAKEKKLGKKR
jgi:NAD-dependent dihydropyrimidine dehydrogenase PreA subunit